MNVLDLSFNNLETVKKLGDMPKDLSVLLMSNNKLTKLSKEIISFVPNLKDFNVDYNQFNNFPAELAKIVAKGSTISFKGTKIHLILANSISHRVCVPVIRNIFSFSFNKIFKKNIIYFYSYIQGDLVQFDKCNNARSISPPLFLYTN